MTLIPSFRFIFAMFDFSFVGVLPAPFCVPVYGAAFFLEKSFLTDARGISFKRQSVGMTFDGRLCTRMQLPRKRCGGIFMPLATALH